MRLRRDDWDLERELRTCQLLKHVIEHPGNPFGSLDCCAAALVPLELLKNSPGTMSAAAPGMAAAARRSQLAYPIAGNADQELTRMPTINPLHLCDLALSIFLPSVNIELITV